MLVRFISILITFVITTNLLAATEDKEKSIFDTDFSNEPTYIKSASLTLKQNERFFSYQRNVEMLQGDMKLTSDLLEGVYDENNKIIHMIAKQNVIITKGESIRATGERARYESKDETMTLTGSPELLQEESVLTADKIIIHLREDRSEAQGNVRVRIKDKEEK